MTYSGMLLSIMGRVRRDQIELEALVEQEEKVSRNSSKARAEASLDKNYKEEIKRTIQEYRAKFSSLGLGDKTK